MQYNADHHITPQQIVKDIKGALTGNAPVVETSKSYRSQEGGYVEPDAVAFAADPIVERMTRQQLEKSIANTTALMKQAAKDLDFIQAAQYRDEIARLQEQLELK